MRENLVMCEPLTGAKFKTNRSLIFVLKSIATGVLNPLHTSTATNRKACVFSSITIIANVIQRNTEDTRRDNCTAPKGIRKCNGYKMLKMTNARIKIKIDNQIR